MLCLRLKTRFSARKTNYSLNTFKQRMMMLSYKKKLSSLLQGITSKKMAVSIIGIIVIPSEQEANLNDIKKNVKIETLLMLEFLLREIF